MKRNKATVGGQSEGLMPDLRINGFTGMMIREWRVTFSTYPKLGWVLGYLPRIHQSRMRDVHVARRRR